MSGRVKSPLFRPWVRANAWSELLGLGGCLGLGFWLFSGMDDSNPGAVIGAGLFAVLAGAFLEGWVVGFAQSRVLRRALRGFASAAWIRATVLGAGIAWALGMIPSTVMSLSHRAADAAPPAEPAGWLLLVLAAGMGLVLGPVLSTPQYFVLRHHVRRAGLWIPANALAWALGMVIVFLGMGTLSESAGALHIILTVSLSCLLAGAVVGAVHGAYLLRLLDRRRRE